MTKCIARLTFVLTWPTDLDIPTTWGSCSCGRLEYVLLSSGGVHTDWIYGSILPEVC